jgi:probable rRNA maturation factor
MRGFRVLLNDCQKTVKIPKGARLLIRRCFCSILSLENFSKSAVLSLTFVDNEKIMELNKKYRNRDEYTDVLSFSLNDMEKKEEFELNPETKEIMLGDVVISLDYVKEQVGKSDKMLRKRIVFLFLHAVLHLFGYTHEEGSFKKNLMLEREELVMSVLGVC